MVPLLADVTGAERLRRTTNDWLELFRAQNIWCAPVNDYTRVFEDPAVQYLEPVQEIDHPRAGTVKLLRHPIRYEAGDPTIRRMPPSLGEHTAEVLRELGCDDEGIAALYRNGVV